VRGKNTVKEDNPKALWRCAEGHGVIRKVLEPVLPGWGKAVQSRIRKKRPKKSLTSVIKKNADPNPQERHIGVSGGAMGP